MNLIILILTQVPFSGPALDQTLVPHVTHYFTVTASPLPLASLWPCSDGGITVAGIALTLIC